ncbi:MAG TPA: hypothetical protein VLF19_03375 [Methylomirabilota bacterium]|nr:hypothetical protein [Methylomirabilota bacterium]
MPFRTRPDQPRDLLSLIESEVRERIEEAVDHVSLEAIVAARRARGLPAPAADNPRDRAEFEAGVGAFLERLRADLEPALTDEIRRKADEAAARAGHDALARLVGAQVALARALPDYWQRFDLSRTAYAAAASGGKRRGLFDRLLAR